MMNRPTVAMLLYPDLTLLDLVGPLEVFSPFADVHLVWKTLDPVRADNGARMLPTATLDTCPLPVDVLFVPGGFGTAALLTDSEVLEQLTDKRTAQLCQLFLEYDPAPPLDTGTPDKAGPALVSEFRTLMKMQRERLAERNQPVLT